MNCFIILPNSLFELKYIKKYKDNHFYIIEDTLFFKDKQRITNFNKKKIILHHSSMKYYFDYLKKYKFNVSYINFNKKNKYSFLKKYNQVNLFNPTDHLLIKRLDKLHNNINYIDNPLFLLTENDLEQFKKDKKIKNNFFHKTFYTWQLEYLNIPFINKSYDELNRNKLNDNVKIPKPFPKFNNKYINKSIDYVNKYFKNNIGNIDNFNFPITHSEAKKLLKYFLKNKLHSFGEYQDAIIDNNPYLFHSLLSSSINIGLLTPQYVLDETIKYYKKNKSKITINNFEGFIRQIIGWREYERMLYYFDYDNLIKSNYWNNKKKLNNKWYNGTLNNKPVDDTINKAIDTGFLNHIERLMIILNFMVLKEIHPKYIYQWFMEFAIDSYDWVMIGNIYGMGYFTTNTMRKPYLSSSNYIIKMSNYKKDDIWDKEWNQLFYRFLYTHKKLLKGGAAIYLRNLRYFEKLSSKEKNDILKLKL